MKFVPVDEYIKNKLARENLDVYLPDSSELNTWLPDFDDETYFSLPSDYVSSSAIMKYFQDSDDRGFFNMVKNHTSALEVGSLIHCHILTPELLHEMADKQARINKHFPDKNKMIDDCVSALKENHDIMDALEGTDRELAGIVDDYLGGKARIKCDAIDHEKGILLDIKTSSKYSPQAFNKDVNNPNGKIPYYIQAAFYLDIANEIAKRQGTGYEYSEFWWLVVCKRTLKTGIVKCRPDLIELGREKIRQYFEEKGWEK